MTPKKKAPLKRKGLKEISKEFSLATIRAIPRVPRASKALIKTHAKTIHALLVGIALVLIAAMLEYFSKSKTFNLLDGRMSTVYAASILAMASRGIGMIIRLLGENEDKDKS